MIKRLIYATLADISLPTGPGVNEREFLTDMARRFGKDLYAVIPNPARSLPPELSGLQVDCMPSIGSARSTASWLSVRAAGRVVFDRAVERFQPDLIVLRSGAVPIPFLGTARRHQIPYVIKTAGDVSFQAFYGGSPVRWLVRPLNEWMSRQLLLQAALIDVVTEAQRDRAIERFPVIADRVVVVDNGVNPARFDREGSAEVRRRYRLLDDEIVIGYVGNYPMRRGAKEVVDVVAELRDAYRVKGLVVGDSGQAAACRAYAADRGMQDSIVVHGEADFAEVPALMGAIDVGLSILRPDERHHSELKVRQYLASGLCVVNTIGSNDFLRDRRFARLISSHENYAVIPAVESLLRLGRPAIGALGREARAFADANLSVSARNDRRLELWTEALAAASQKFHGAGC